MSSSRFAAYLSSENIQKLFRYNIANLRDVSRLFDMPNAAETQILGIEAHHTYRHEELDELLTLVPVFWKNKSWGRWRDLAMVTAIDDLFDEEGNIKKEIWDALNKNDQLQPLINESGPADPKIKRALLLGYYSTFVMGPFIKTETPSAIDQSSLKSFYLNDPKLLKKTQQIDPEITTEKINLPFFFEWLPEPLKRINAENIDSQIQIYRRYTPEMRRQFIDEEKNIIKPDTPEIKPQLVAEDKPGIPEMKPQLELAAEAKPGFFARNWPYFAIGALVVAGMVALGIITFGLGPAVIAVGALALKGLALLGIAIAATETAFLIAGVISLALGAIATYAAVTSAAIGIHTLTTSSTKQMHETLKLDKKEKVAHSAQPKDASALKTPDETKSVSSGLQPPEKPGPSRKANK